MWYCYKHNLGDKMKIYVATSLLILASIVALSGCGFKRPVAKWEDGTFVRSVLSNQQGQIIKVRCFESTGPVDTCYYDVRFIGLELTTNTHVTSSDGAVSSTPLSVVEYMREYELKDDTK
jgi:hypothetical protein